MAFRRPTTTDHARENVTQLTDGERMDPQYHELKERLCPSPRDPVTDALLDALVQRAMDITHEAGTLEGTLEAYMTTIVEFLDGWDGHSTRFEFPFRRDQT